VEDLAVAADGPAVAAVLAEEAPVAAGKIPTIPLWARDILHERDLAKISEAVREAELRTEGEIVPMVVRRSSVFSSLPLMLTLIMLVLILVLEVPQGEFFAEFNAYWVLFFLAAFCYGVSLLLCRWQILQRLFVPMTDQIFQVEMRAQLEFYLQGLNRTRARTGILLFVSLMERRAVVLADQAIAEKLPRETWDHVCHLILNGIKKGQTGEGFANAIRKCGEYLTQHFPATENNPNELSNQLILKE
jgi:putative membrane protein